MFKCVKFPIREYPSDCLICAIRPSLNFNKLHIFNADYCCYHSRISSNPQFKASKTFQLLSLTYCLVLIAGIAKDVIKLREGLDPEDLLTMIRIANSICIAYCQLCYILLTKSKLVVYNGVLSIISHRKSFGLKFMLTKSDVKRMKTRMIHAVLFASSLELLNFMPLLGLDNVGFELFVDVATSELATFGFLCILVLVSSDFEIFSTLYQRCISQIEMYLSGYEQECPFEEQLWNRTATKVEKLQTMQRLYMAIGKSFKYCEIVFPADVMIAYIVTPMVLVLLEGYVFVLYFRGRLHLNIFDCQILWKSLLIIFGCSLCCIQMHRIRALVDDRLSYLFKIPITKLNRTEATQIEMVIRMIVEQRPELRASEMYTWGPNIVLSILATGITYMLVALQFRLFW